MKCVSCGAELAEGSLLCPQCGRVVEAADVARQKAAAGQLDAILLLALGLWLHLGKSRICALVTLAYGILNMVMAVISSGQLQGWWIALAGAWAVAYTFQFHKMWNKYRKEGVVPKDAVEK